MRRLIVMALSLVVVVALGLPVVGCSQSPSAAEQQAQCFQNEALLQTEMKLFTADTGGVEAPFATVIAKTHAVCPSGGKYSWDAATGIVTCSVHGHPK